MKLDRAIDISSRATPSDSSGTPIALLELVRAAGDLVVAPSLKDDEVLVEYPLSPGWRRRLGVTRFVRLRRPRKGKSYAVVSKARQASGPKRRRKKAAPRAEAPLIPYPESDPVGARLGYEGAGIMAYQTLDQMHPPMVDSEELWSDADRWPVAAREHTRAAARALCLRPGERVLDIGCGIGGPARLLVDEFGVTVQGIGNAQHMLDTANRINARNESWSEAITVCFQDCQEPYDLGEFDAAWCMNMIYRVPDKAALIANAAAALRPGGRIMVEDWMLTPTATAADRSAMDAHHFAGAIAGVSELEALFEEAGFSVIGREDFGAVGRTHMRRHFEPQFNAKVRPRLEADFPGRPQNGAEMADQWVAGIEATIAMYVSGRMTYRRIVAELSR